MMLCKKSLDWIDPVVEQLLYNNGCLSCVITMLCGSHFDLIKFLQELSNSNLFQPTEAGLISNFSLYLLVVVKNAPDNYLSKIYAKTYYNAPVKLLHHKIKKHCVLNMQEKIIASSKHLKININGCDMG